MNKLLPSVSLAALLVALSSACAAQSTPASGPTPVIELAEFVEELLAPIAPIVPADGFVSSSPAISLTWSWARPLQPDELYAVSLWREGDSANVVSLTDQPHFFAGEWLQLHGAGPGAFLWKVVVIRLSEGQEPLIVTADAQPLRFEVSSMDIPTPLFTPIDLMADDTSIPASPGEYAIETVVENTGLVVAMAFAPDGRLFYTEKEGTVRVAVNGQLQAEPVIELATDSFGERGMIGIAIDPDFDSNHYIWISHTAPPASEGAYSENRVIRFVERDGRGSDPQIALAVPILTDKGGHQIGNLHFGPDNMLYMAMGDNEERINAQNPDTIPGKIHRFVPTIPLGIPDDNPLPGNSLYALGMRNPWDFDFDPLSGTLFAQDNGQHCDDEINRIEPGANYGWHASYLCDDERIAADYTFEAPLMFFTPAIVPTGIVFYTGDQFPEWQDDLLFCSLLIGKIFRVELDNARTQSQSLTQIDTGEARCSVALLNGPDGALYYSASDSIQRIVAP